MLDIKFVVFDFDGVFTNGKCYFDSSNNINKYYNIRDGMALKILRDNNIKYGLLSSYSTTRQVQLNENNINNEIINHLQFDYISIGKDLKIITLNKWLQELNYSYNNVAYIGDDINDIEVLQIVKFSACPNDAVNNCKNVVNYICDKNGGDGCVREFVDVIMNNNKTIVDEIKSEIHYQLNNVNLNKIHEIKNIITKTNGNIYFTGIGKSGNMAKHCADLLKSLSIKSFYFDITNGLHGDIGTLDDNDIIIMFSKSGNTKEIVEIIPYLKHRNVKTIGVCCDTDSLFKQLCDVIIEMPFQNEIMGTINKIPTNSCMSHLLFSNILISLIKKNITLDMYKNNHPAGAIGNNLKKVKDIMKLDFPKLLLVDNINIYDILLIMTNKKIGCCFFVDEKDKLLGILTDGDIRRLLLNDHNTLLINITNINTDYYYVNNIDEYVCNIRHNIIIPILDNKIIIGVISQ